MNNKSVQTIADIARLANVSKSTVSRALNDSPLIGKETKERIRTIAHEHNFRINAPARQLSQKQSRTIALVFQAIKTDFTMADLFILEIMRSVSNGLYENGYDMLLLQIDPSDIEWAHKYLHSRRVDGFILLNSAQKPHHIQALVEMGAPFVVWGTPQFGYAYCSVSGDNFTGGRLATQHLIQSGRRRIAFLGGPAEHLEIQNRFQGYIAALQEAGLETDPVLITYGDYTNTSGAAAMQQLLEQSPDLDAVFVNSDLMAIAAMKVIGEHGRRVPEEVAVVGYDDLSIAEYSNPPLTTIRQNLSLAGKLLAQNLIHNLQTGEVTNSTIPIELILRKSA